MKKRKNRIYRRIAVALTVALLVGQSHAFVLAEEGDAPQTEISSEGNQTDAPDNGNAVDSGNVENGDIGNTGNGTEQGGETNGGADNQEKCVCGTACTEDAVNGDCPVCAADYAACAGKADDTENNAPEGDGTENENGNLDGQEQCICEIKCAEDTVNGECPVCVADYAACVGEETEEILPETVMGDALDAEAGIEMLAEVGVQGQCICLITCTKDVINRECPVCVANYTACAKNQGEEFYSGELRFRVIGDDQVELPLQTEASLSGQVPVTGTIVIPETVEHGEKTYRVTRIGKAAFLNFNISGVVIPSSVTSIEYHAFASCNYLTDVTIPDSVKTIGMGAFSCCTRLEKITIPDSVTEMESDVFEKCIGLKDVKLSNNTGIYLGTFQECTSLEEITIPYGVRKIRGAFKKCTSLKKVTIPNSVEDISGSFAGCVALDNVVIPDSVTEIGSDTFENCSNLKTLKMVVSGNKTITPPATDYSAFVRPYFEQKDDRQLVFVSADGVTELTGEDLKAAQQAYRDVNDGNPNDNFWYGWKICPITIRVKIDDRDWTGHNRVFGLKPADTPDAETITDFISLPDGAYRIYDITDPAHQLDTKEDMTVTDGTAGADVQYFTLSYKTGGGSTTAWRIQNCLKGYAPESALSEKPNESGYEFKGWVTEYEGDTPYDFSAPLYAPTNVYAKWEKEIVPTYKVKINFYKDDQLWTTDCDRKIVLSKTWGKYVTDFDAVEAGEYNFYDATDERDWVNGGVIIKVPNADADNTVRIDYYTVTFCDADGTPYGDETPQKPQVVLKTKGKIAYPGNPAKEGNIFEKWVTQPGGDDSFNFGSEITKPTKVYAKWKESTVPANTYTVTINVKKDNQDWENHGRTFALLPGSGGFLNATGKGEASAYKISAVPNGTYSVYDTTGVSTDVLYSKARDTGMDVRVSGMDTQVTVTVNGADVTAGRPVNYYTVTFYDRDASGNEVAYEPDTDQRPQIVLSGQKVTPPISDPTEPKDPGKSGQVFDGWKTEDGAAYDFGAAVSAKQKIYASWRSENTPPTRYTITVIKETEGGSISPSGPSVHVNKGDNAEFVITSNEGYRIKAVTVDGTDRTAELADALGGGKSYTFINVTSNHSIRVEFEKDGNGGGDNPDSNPNPNPNPNPDPGGDNPGGGGDDDDDDHSGGGGGDNGGSDGGNTNPGGGDNQNPDGGNNGGGNNSGGNAGNGGGSVTPDGGTAGTSDGRSAADGARTGAAGSAAGGSAFAISGQTAGATGTAANGKEPKTGDTSYLQVYATLAMIAGLTYLLLYVLEESRGMTEREKEAFVAAFIRWGKKGGAFRKCCAVAAIFCLLAYYHTVGKRAGGSALREKYVGQAF